MAAQAKLNTYSTYKGLPAAQGKGQKGKDMRIDFRTDARNANNSGWVTVDSEKVFNFDAFSLSHNPEESAFLAGLTQEWKLIPARLLDQTTRENFICYARLARA